MLLFNYNHNFPSSLTASRQRLWNFVVPFFRIKFLSCVPTSPLYLKLAFSPLSSSALLPPRPVSFSLFSLPSLRRRTRIRFPGTPPDSGLPSPWRRCRSCRVVCFPGRWLSRAPGPWTRSALEGLLFDILVTLFYLWECFDPRLEPSSGPSTRCSFDFTTPFLVVLVLIGFILWSLVGW